jgi:hypothetical protein
VHREHQDRSIVNAGIGMVNTQIGHRERDDQDRERADRSS